MHGNTRYMHCSDEEKDCSRQFYMAPTLSDVTDRTNHVPVCSVCGANMKPHAMFFDESYSEHYYRDRTTNDAAEEIDALIVIGTAL
jgi:NAD-dependent SIR2 family protein deacetylase